MWEDSSLCGQAVATLQPVFVLEATRPALGDKCKGEKEVVVLVNIGSRASTGDGCGGGANTVDVGGVARDAPETAKEAGAAVSCFVVYIVEEGKAADGKARMR